MEDHRTVDGVVLRHEDEAALPDRLLAAGQEANLGGTGLSIDDLLCHEARLTIRNPN